MGLLKSLFTNCAHPKGRMGRAMLKFMNLTHAPLTSTLSDIGGSVHFKRPFNQTSESRSYKNRTQMSAIF